MTSGRLRGGKQENEGKKAYHVFGKNLREEAQLGHEERFAFGLEKGQKMAEGQG